MNTENTNTLSATASGTAPALGLATGSVVFDGRIDQHPMHRAIYELMGEIEKLPGSEQQTKVVTMAWLLHNQVTVMRGCAQGNAKTLRLYGAECFPADENGQIHFARAIMEAVADNLDEHLNPNSQNNQTRNAPPSGE
jgi:hypothetical protein